MEKKLFVLLFLFVVLFAFTDCHRQTRREKEPSQKNIIFSGEYPSGNVSEETVSGTPLEVVNDMIRCAKNKDENGLSAHFVKPNYTEWWSFNSWVGSESNLNVFLQNQNQKSNSIFEVEVHCRGRLKTSEYYNTYMNYLVVFDLRLEKQSNGGWKVTECSLSQAKSQK